MEPKSVPVIIIGRRVYSAFLKILFILIKSAVYISSFVVFSLLMCSIFVFASFFFLYRLFLFYFITNCGSLKLCSTSDSFFLIDHNWTNMFYSVVCVLKGEARLKEVTTMVMRRLILAKTSNGKEFAKHFKHYPIARFGYFMWKEEDNFDIDEHVLEYRKASATSEQHLSLIINDIINEPFPRNKSPWYLYLIHICEDKENPTKRTGFCLIFCVHHGLGDGLSALNALEHYMNEDDEDNEDWNNRFKSLNKRTPLMTKIAGMATLASDFFIELLSKRKSVLHGPLMSGERIGRVSPLIDLSSIKYLKNVTHSTVTNVMLSCVAGAFRSYFKRKKLPIPSGFGAWIPMPLRTKTAHDQFFNHLAGAPLNLPLKEKTPLARLEAVRKCFVRTSLPYLTYCNYFMVNFIGVLPIWLARLFLMLGNDTMVFTNVPGPQKTLNLLNGQTYLFHYSLGSIYGRQGIGISFNTYKNKAKIGIVVDRVLINDETEVEKILEDITLELDNLTEEVKKLKMTETVENP